MNGNGNNGNGRDPVTGKFYPGHTIGSENHWKPGQCGNPGGQPKNFVKISGALARVLSMDAGHLKTYKPGTRGNKVADDLAIALVRRGLKGDVRAVVAIKEATEGKLVVKTTDQTGPLGGETVEELLKRRALLISGFGDGNKGNPLS